MVSGSIDSLQLSGLVGKAFDICAGGPRFDFLGGEPKIFHRPSLAKSQMDVDGMRH